MIHYCRKAILKSNGFEKTGNCKNGLKNLDLFENEAKQTKMIMGTQRASIDGYKTIKAVFHFTRIDDIVTIDNKRHPEVVCVVH